MSRFSKSKSLAEIKQEQKESDTRILNLKITDCIERMGTIQLKMIECDDETEKDLLQRQLKMELRKRESYTQHLAKLGKKEEKRGRPKKDQGQRYQEQRVKFTAWLKPENLLYVRELKTTKQIPISQFLDTFIEQHRNSHQN